MSDVLEIRQVLVAVSLAFGETEHCARALAALARVEATLSELEAREPSESLVQRNVELEAINRQMSAAEGPQRLAAAEARAVAAEAECDCEGEAQCPRGIRDALCSPAPAEPPERPT